MGPPASQHALGFSVVRLQGKLERLEWSSVSWSTEANKCEERLMSNVHYCVFKEEISEVSPIPSCPTALVSNNPLSCL